MPAADAGRVDRVLPQDSRLVLFFQVESWMIGGQYQLVNMNGQELLSAVVSSEVEQLNIADLADGIYILNFQAEGKSISRKITIRR